jgi:hypothetical protein
MKIYCEINDENVRRAASLVMKHYRDEDFLARIRSIPKFNFTEDSPKSVSEKLPQLMDVLEIKIVPYKSINPFSKAIGYAQGKTIFLNTRKNNMTVLDRVETIYHEATHLCGYAHDGNRVTLFNLLTVPYLSASLFARFVKEIYG